MSKIASNGIELEVEIIGEGEPLVMIMGLGSQMVQWPEGLCAMLVEAGFQVIRFDNRDIGLSTWFDDAPVPDMRRLVMRGYAGLKVEAPYTLEDMAADTAGLIEALGLGAAHIFGISMGGMIAQTVAIEHPERVRSMVSMMSTTGSRKHGLTTRKALKALVKPQPPTREGRIDQSVEFLRLLNGPVFAFDEARIRKMVGLSYDRAHHPRGFVRQFAAIIASGSRVERLSKIKTPTTVIHGTQDPLVGASGGRATAAAIPNARLQWIEGLGHALPEGSWPAIVEAISHNTQRSTPQSR